jgi:hypothetical protein
MWAAAYVSGICSLLEGCLWVYYFYTIRPQKAQGTQINETPRLKQRGLDKAETYL